jgi:GrpB-like predicted nucleotidyltransferase (UPF0157 family)
MTDGEMFTLASMDTQALTAEAARVIAAVSSMVPECQVLEVGSTAVPGAIGKGDIDILVRAAAGDFENARRTLDGAFQRNPDQFSSEEFQGYTVASVHDVALQLTVAGCPHDCFEAFVLALRSDATLLARYNALKREWDGRPMDAYRDAKAKFIRATLGLEG